MIAIRDILIFLAGGILVYVSILTRNYICGKRMSVYGLTQKEEPYQPRKIVTDIPEPDAARFSRLIANINTIDDFEDTYSKRVKDR